MVNRLPEARALWRVAARIDGAAAAAAATEILDPLASAVTAFEVPNGDGSGGDGSSEDGSAWAVEAYAPVPLLDTALEIRLALAAAAAGGALVALSEERLAERDWLAENLIAFPPQRIGRFWVHGSHHRGAAPASAIAIEIDAATAFGTGEHASTRGCLAALGRLHKRQHFARPLDIGTGTGILAMAAAKLLRRPVTASDIDAAAVRVARHNLRCNGLAGRVRVCCAAGYRDRRLRRVDPDLVFANILARPLALMARDLARVLEPGGRAVLSGLLRRQERVVLAAHRGLGLVLAERLRIDGWSTLVLRRRRR